MPWGSCLSVDGIRGEKNTHAAEMISQRLFVYCKKRHMGNGNYKSIKKIRFSRRFLNI